MTETVDALAKAVAHLEQARDELRRAWAADPGKLTAEQYNTMRVAINATLMAASNAKSVLRELP